MGRAVLRAVVDSAKKTIDPTVSAPAPKRRYVRVLAPRAPEPRPEDARETRRDQRQPMSAS